MSAYKPWQQISNTLVNYFVKWHNWKLLANNKRWNIYYLITGCLLERASNEMLTFLFWFCFFVSPNHFCLLNNIGELVKETRHSTACSVFSFHNYSNWVIHLVWIEFSLEFRPFKIKIFNVLYHCNEIPLIFLQDFSLRFLSFRRWWAIDIFNQIWQWHWMPKHSPIQRMMNQFT